MGFIGVGIALIVLGIILTFTNVFGFAIGLPLTGIGIALIVVGIVLAVVHFVTNSTRRATTTRRY